MMNLRHSSQIKKAVIIFTFAMLMLYFEHQVVTLIALVLFLITLIEIFRKQDTFLTIYLQKTAVVLFETIAKLIIGTLYATLILPMGLLLKTKIRKEFEPKVAQESDNWLEGCICEIDLERSY